MNVLLVDDNEDIRLVFRFLLGSEGVSVHEASSGPEALQRLASGPLPDVMVLDVQMPDLDGWETLEAVRSQAATTDLPVILCTVKGRPVDTVRGWEVGCDGYVEKPFNVDAMLAEVRAVAAMTADDRATRRKEALERARRELRDVERNRVVGT